MHRNCVAPTASGNACIGAVLPGRDVCAVHADPETKSAHMRELARKSQAARKQRAEDDLGDVLATCKFETLESIEGYLEAMARYAISRNDPRFLTGASRVVETSRWYLEAKRWKAECMEWRKRFKVKKSIDGDES